MIYNIDLVIEAHQDILEAIIWYNTQRKGLGAEFYEEIEKLKKRLAKEPTAFEIKYKKNVRWIHAERFPLHCSLCN